MVMIYWQLNKLTGRTGQWMVRSERVNRVYSDEDESPPGRPPFMIVRTFLHICSLFVGKFATRFFKFKSTTLDSLPHTFRNVEFFLYFILNGVFLRAIQLRWDKRNTIHSSKSCLELQFGNLIIFFFAAKHSHFAMIHTQSVSNQCYAAHWIAYQMAVHKSVPCTTLRRNLKSIYMRIWNAFGNPMIFFSSIPFRQRVRKVVN